MNLAEQPHRRYNPLAGEWVLVSPQRTRRPWLGQTESPPPDTRLPYDPACYLCPGNKRAGGAQNPPYRGTFVFDNDFAALLPGSPSKTPPPPPTGTASLLRAEPERGICRVMCYSPQHNLTLPEMPLAVIERVVEVWVEQYRELGARPHLNWVQIFENKGAIMGASNPHPHGQIWATETLPNLPAREDRAQARYHAEHGRTLLADYLDLELKLAERLVAHNDHFVALVPYWAVWPFETMLISRRPVPAIDHLTGDERAALAGILKQVTVRYDNLFQTSFPYSFGLHQQPTGGQAHPHWHLHAHFLPPLLRSATVKKFMVGFELLATPQRDITAEQAAQRLRDLPAAHYKSGLL